MGYKNGDEVNVETSSERCEPIKTWAKYHAEWNWLMPVVKKILNEMPVSGISISEIKEGVLEVNIRYTWTQVVNYIESYNTQTYKKMALTSEEILRGNELIALFDGWEFINDAPEAYPQGYYMQDGCGIFEPNEFIYHNTWEWLMPIVQKLENLPDCAGFHITESHVYANYKNEDDSSLFYEAIYYKSHSKLRVSGDLVNSNIFDSDLTKIECVWKMVVLVVEWYNKVYNK